MRIKKLNTEISSKINRSLVLGQIHRHPLISRVELAGRTGLDRSAITHILNDLLKLGLVEEVKKGKAGARGGRCPIQLQIRADAGSIGAVEIGLESVTGVLVDFDGKEKARMTAPITRGEPLLDILIQFLDALRRRHRVLFSSVRILGVTCPGVVESARGRLLLNLYHGWKDVDVAEQLQQRYAIPVVLENDANAAALGELHAHQQTAEMLLQSLIYLFVRESTPGSPSPLGVGGGLILNGRLWEGAHWCAGEVSQTINLVFSRIMQPLDKARDARTSAAWTLTELLGASERREAAALQALDDIAGQIGKLLGEFAAFLDTEGVLVCIHPPEGKEPLLERIHAAFLKNYRSPVMPSIQFLRPLLGIRAPLEGVIRMGMDHVFIRDTTQNSVLFP